MLSSAEWAQVFPPDWIRAPWAHAPAHAAFSWASHGKPGRGGGKGGIRCIGPGELAPLRRGPAWPCSAPPTPCVTFRLVVAPLRGPEQSPVLPFACCVASLLSVGRCGRCSCWCRFRVRGAQWFVCWAPPPPHPISVLGSEGRGRGRGSNKSKANSNRVGAVAPHVHHELIGMKRP